MHFLILKLPKRYFNENKEKLKRQYKKKWNSDDAQIKLVWCTHFGKDVYRKDKTQQTQPPKNIFSITLISSKPKYENNSRKNRKSTCFLSRSATYLVVRLSQASCNVVWKAIGLLGRKLCCKPVALNKTPEQRMKMSLRCVSQTDQRTPVTTT